MTKIWKFIKGYWIDAVAFVVVGVLFIVPFIFILLTASKSRKEAGLFEFSLPQQFQLFQNISDVIKSNDYRMALALWNSTILTVSSVTLKGNSSTRPTRPASDCVMPASKSNCAEPVSTKSPIWPRSSTQP